jgi:DNA polymerase
MDERFEVTALATLASTIPAEPDVLCTSLDGKSVEELIRERLEQFQDQYGPDLENVTVVAHNAAFDGMILARRYGIHPPYFIDTLGLARHWDARARNDLGRLAKRLGLQDKGETKAFRSLTNRMRYSKQTGRGRGPKLPMQQPVMTREEQEELGEYAKNDVLLERDVLCQLLPRLSTPEVELRVMQHTLELFWQPCLEVDTAKADEIKTLMRAEVDQAIEHASAILGRTITRKELSGTNSFEDLLLSVIPAGEDVGQYTKPAKCKKGWKLAIAKTDDARELLLEHDDVAVRAVMEAWVALKSWPTHIKRVDRIVTQAEAAGGCLPVPIKYHGAHTGRWSGAEKINLQNLGSRGHPLVNAVREIIVAPPGHTLVIADASQIEARGLAWLAGQWDLLEKFENGEEIYCGFAEKVLGYPVRKPREDGIPAIEARMKWARNSVGKVGVLGCGYGMGADKAISYSGGALDLATARDLVQTYRAENPAVVQLWENLEKAFVYAYRYHLGVCLYGLRIAPGASVDPVLDPCDMTITLPSGRTLYYQSVRVKDRRGQPSPEIFNPKEKTWVRIWGGYLTENVVQALSRDILWDAIARLEEQGHHVAMHVHDELIAVVPEAEGEVVLANAIEALSVRPWWAPDLPLAAEGIVTPRYGGH